MSNRPVLRLIVKTRTSFEARPNSFMNLATFWKNDNGYISGKLADAKWSPEGKDKFGVTSICLKDGVIQPDDVWVNAKIEQEKGRVWVKTKDGGETTSLFSFTLKRLEDGSVRVDNYTFADGVTSINFRVVEPSGNEIALEVPVGEMFLNGTAEVTLPEPEVEGCPF